MAPAHSSTVLKPTRSVLALAVALVLAFAAPGVPCAMLHHTRESSWSSPLPVTVEEGPCHAESSGRRCNTCRSLTMSGGWRINVVLRHCTLRQGQPG